MLANADQRATNSDEITSNVGTTRIITLPPFMESEPKFWFDVVEMKFSAAQLNDPVERFVQTFSALSVSASLLAKDLVKPPINSESYSRLKERVVSRLTLSHEQRIRQLLKTETMGDDKPSIFLLRLKDLAGPDVSEVYLRTIWEGRLPSGIRLYVTMNPDVSLSKAAEIGDLAYEFIKSLNTRTEKATEDMISCILNRLSRMEEKLASQQINQLEIRRELSRSRGDRRGRSRSLTRSHSRSRDADRVCWYHWRFAENAKKCKQPCTYHSTRNAPGTC
ncbi:uncharacterized protein LOC109601141 [Aethina tumida]|uniref:uncharacterized protein LOC109601141 n=1 Tax=Aethina tumida TaxID=116153 RepID=UPI00096B031C|nr:uncharacterized protein LOC109601141 [Aethina tumida]